MTWWPEPQWQEMLDGTDCPLCTDGHLPANPHSVLITELATSYLRLHRNQTHRGYSVLVLKRHACELHELHPDELAGFWADVARAAAAIAGAFQPVKLDYLVMGHRCPHLHCHLYPQYHEDDPLRVIDISEGAVRLSEAEQATRVALLQERLADQPGPG